ncbi:MAG: hypothetical protein RL213_1149 [Bacteroidota bacterium]|jgi:(2Fe-2S) ferredoxin
MRFRKHIFICTNQRVEGSRPSCGEACGLELVAAFKKEIKEAGLSTEVRAQRAGCLDACEHGPSLVVYPDGVFYGKVTPGDVAEIIREHIVNGRLVSRLAVDFDKS